MIAKERIISEWLKNKRIALIPTVIWVVYFENILNFKTQIK